MAGEEQEGSLASVETRVSTKYMLLQTLSRSTGRPGESPERHQQDGLRREGASNRSVRSLVCWFSSAVIAQQSVPIQCHHC